MPPAKRPSAIRQGFAIAVLAALLALLAWTSWVAAVAFVALVSGLAWVGSVAARRTAAERRGDSICTFARALDRREVDPWVVRAVYEHYSESFPVRAEDVLDAEEMDFAAMEIAERTGRSLDQVERNPRFGRVRTAGDLVRFLSHQPLRGTGCEGSL